MKTSRLTIKNAAGSCWDAVTASPPTLGSLSFSRCQDLLLLHRSTAVQVRSSVRLMRQKQPSGRGSLPSPTAWSPDQHPATMLADVSRHILDRTEGGGLGFGLHSQREVSAVPVLFSCAFKQQCPVRRRKIAVYWARSSLRIGSRYAW